MATAEDVLNIERRWLEAGTREIPDGSNRVQGITDRGGFIPAAWCDAFQITCLREAGVDAGPHTMWVSTTFDYFRKQGRTFRDAHSAQPGDLIAFEWGTTAGGYDHIGMVESVRPDGLVTIEGNIGNRVQRLFRAWNSGMAEFARPAYSTPAPPPPPPPAPQSKIKTRNSEMYTITNAAGATEKFALRDNGEVWNQWRNVLDVEFTPWQKTFDGDIWESMNAPMRVGNAIWIEVAGEAQFGFQTVTAIQPGPGQPWQLVLTNDLAKFLNTLKK